MNKCVYLRNVNVTCVYTTVAYTADTLCTISCAPQLLQAAGCSYNYVWCYIDKTHMRYLLGELQSGALIINFKNFLLNWENLHLRK